MRKLIFLSDIDLDASPLVRASLNDEVVTEYSGLYKEKKCPLPPPLLYRLPKSKSYLVADGRHRIGGAQQAKLRAIVGEVRDGTEDECLTAALSANVTHGLRRTQADKRRAIALAYKRWPDLSDRQLAEMCSVDNKTVAAFLADQKPKREERIGSDGKTYSAPKKTKSKSEPEPQVRNSSPEPKPVDQDKDKTGFAIPKDKELLAIWNRSPEASALIESLSNIKCAVERAQKDRDELYAEVNFSAVIADLEKAYHGLKVAVPHALCPTCQGKLREKCKMCCGRGFVSEFRWKTIVPAELKKLRAGK